MSKRIILAAVQNERDVSDLANLLSDDSLVKKAGLLIQTDDLQRLMMVKLLVSKNHIALVRSKSDGQVIGMLMLSSRIDEEGKKINHQYELGYLLRKEQWGQGLMTEAVSEMLALLSPKINVFAECAEDNVQSQRVLEKSGFYRLDDQLWQYHEKA